MAAPIPCGWHSRWQNGITNRSLATMDIHRHFLTIRSMDPLMRIISDRCIQCVKCGVLIKMWAPITGRCCLCIGTRPQFDAWVCSHCMCSSTKWTIQRVLQIDERWKFKRDVADVLEIHVGASIAGMIIQYNMRQWRFNIHGCAMHAVLYDPPDEISSYRPRAVSFGLRETIRRAANDGHATANSQRVTLEGGVVRLYDSSAKKNRF